MAKRLLEPSSKISTYRRCDNCGITIDQVAWKQCLVCNVFDLCSECGKLPNYTDLLPGTRNRHRRFHEEISANESITDACLVSVLVEEGEKYGDDARKKIREKKYNQIQKEKKIGNDFEMAIIMEKLKQLEPSPPILSEETESNRINSLIARYHLQASQRNIRVLSLDGGGVRGYMPIKILTELITKEHLSMNEQLNPTDPTHKELFKAAQLQFTNQFDYFVGTSTGGIIAFCLAMNYNIMDLEEIYSQSSYYFKRNRLGPLIYSKYDPSRIHHKIDEIINGLKYEDGPSLSAETATLLDIRNLLNPRQAINDNQSEAAAPYHGNFLEFTDDKNFKEDLEYIDEGHNLHRAKSEKVLLITSYNTTTNSITIFNTSYSKHWGYRIADVIKATMAAPTYFPPHVIHSGNKVNGHFVKDGVKSELYIDGGVFANDPELAALAAIRMQWKKIANYHLLSIGTGCYTTTLSSSTLGGYFGWIFNNGFLVNTLMDATRSFIETIGSNLAKFNDMRRMKLNYQITKPMDLDDGSFVEKFDQEWETLKNEADFKAFIYFYEKYIVKQHL